MKQRRPNENRPTHSNYAPVPLFVAHFTDVSTSSGLGDLLLDEHDGTTIVYTKLYQAICYGDQVGESPSPQNKLALAALAASMSWTLSAIWNPPGHMLSYDLLAQTPSNRDYAKALASS
jgi:hypothetical protein